jgi:hypothetical protein
MIATTATPALAYQRQDAGRHCSLLADGQRGLFRADLLGQQQCQLDECCGSEDRGNLPVYRESYTRYLIYDRILLVNRFKTNDRVVFAP